eukprot:6213379-Pleurochrysis_carterae.AAC.1
MRTSERSGGGGCAVRPRGKGTLSSGASSRVEAASAGAAAAAAVPDEDQKLKVAQRAALPAKRLQLAAWGQVPHLLRGAIVQFRRGVYGDELEISPGKPAACHQLALRRLPRLLTVAS